MEGFMMSQQSGLKVLMPNFGYNCLVRTVLQFLFLFYEVIFKYHCFFVLFRCEAPLFRVLKASLFKVLLVLTVTPSILKKTKPIIIDKVQDLGNDMR